mmetsp:Transcript_1923/g.4347  ORF Transcript_1923/g.4347 Transcript_1923/m.4347 type:complete len:208 (-) Transcript_1923:1804-2427(-)
MSWQWHARALEKRRHFYCPSSKSWEVTRRLSAFAPRCFRRRASWLFKRTSSAKNSRTFSRRRFAFACWLVETRWRISSTLSQITRTASLQHRAGCSTSCSTRSSPSRASSTSSSTRPTVSLRWASRRSCKPSWRACRHRGKRYFSLRRCRPSWPILLAPVFTSRYCCGLTSRQSSLRRCESNSSRCARTRSTPRCLSCSAVCSRRIS